MNKFNVNTQGIDGIGIIKVCGGKINCTLDEFIDMHSAECIEENSDDTLYYFRNKVVEKMGYPLDRVSIGKHHPNTFVEGQNTFVPMWEGEEFVCYVDVAKQETYVLSDIIEGDGRQNTVYESEFDFFIEQWDENRFYPRKPI